MFQFYKVFITAVLSIISFNSLAHDFRVGDIIIQNPTINEAPPVAPVAGGYLIIKNTGSVDDKLISATSTFANLVEIHEMKVENDIMQMQEIEGGIIIPAGKSIKLQPGGLHIMFMQLQKPMKLGREYAATLTFEKAGEIKVYFEVKKIQGKH